MFNCRIVSPSEYRTVKTPSVKLRNPFVTVLNELEELLENVEKEITKRESKSKLRDKVDGSFLVRIDRYGYPELAQRLLDYSAKRGLTVSGDNTANTGRKGSIAKVQIGDSLIFGGNSKFDVDWVKTSERKGVDELFYDGRNFASMYNLSADYGTIIDAIDEMAEEKRVLMHKRAEEMLSGDRPLVPTYYELKQAKEGEKLVKKQREKNLDKELETAKRKICGCTSNVLEGITFDYNFIRIGDNFIPVNDNQTVYISV